MKAQLGTLACKPNREQARELEATQMHIKSFIVRDRNQSGLAFERLRRLADHVRDDRVQGVGLGALATEVNVLKHKPRRLHEHEELVEPGAEGDGGGLGRFLIVEGDEVETDEAEFIGPSGSYRVATNGQGESDFSFHKV